MTVVQNISGNSLPLSDRTYLAPGASKDVAIGPYEVQWINEGKMLDNTGANSRPPASHSDLPSRRFRVRRPQLTVLTSFQTGHGWTAANGAGADDTATPYFPDRSYAVTYAAAGSGRLTSPALTAMDLTAKGVAFAVKVDDRSKLSALDLEITSDAFAHFTAIGSLKLDPRVVTDGEWALIPFQVSADNGANATNTAITGLRAKGQANAAMQPVVDHGFAATYPLDAAARCVIFLDDGSDDQYEMALRALRQGLKICMAIRPGALDTAGHLTTAQALDLQARGVEMVPHAYNVADHDADGQAGRTLLIADPRAFEASLVNMRNLMIAKGLTSGLEHYCYAPNFDGGRESAMKRVAYDLVKKWYPGMCRTAYTAGFNGPIQPQVPLDFERRLQVGQFTVGTNSAVANWTNAGTGWLDRIAYSKGVGIAVFHKMQTAADSGLYVSRANWDLFTAALAAKTTIRSCTLTEAFAA